MQLRRMSEDERRAELERSTETVREPWHYENPKGERELIEQNGEHK